MYTWVDASYAVHRDMKSHTGGAVSFGRGVIMSKSSKQKLNTKSSTEAELVGASNYLPYPIWMKKFLEAQGYTLNKNVFYQDNQSTIRLERNGRKSCGPNSRHIDIQYFFIKNRLELEDIVVEHCPTEQMLADFYTKPLQGNLFRKFRAVVMGQVHINSLKDILPVPIQERVGIKNETDNLQDRTVSTEKVGSGTGVWETDVTSHSQRKPTYAEVVAGGNKQQQYSESEGICKEQHRLTLTK